MNAIAIQASTLGERWDAKFHILLAEHRELANELLAVMDADELCALARALPYDHRAAEAIFPPMNQGTFGKSRGQSFFFGWIGTPSQWRGSDKPKFLAAYCAVAAQFTLAKVYTELLELSKQKKAKLEALNGLIKTAKDKGAAKLLEAFKRSSGD